MLEILFGNQNTERILFTILLSEKCYAKQLADHFGTALFGFQTTLQKLEKANILVSFKEGSTRIFQFNPRYPFLQELKQLIQKAYEFLPKDIKEKYYEPVSRTRPRRTGKPL
ncbi:MAG: winged helix-turn-helix transcriptional regulator [Nitrospirae bacterium]|nr:winged helix-turn-helix transcriptional regulator [Nitrospirota bacterium]